MEYIIVDVDAGSDDALALMVLVAGERTRPYRVVAITCTYGNTIIDHVSRNVLLVLESLNRTDIPVFKGAACPLLGPPKHTTCWHGNDGFGDKTFSAPVAKVQEESAIVALNRLAKQYPGVHVMCLGPLTNLALALRCYPDLRALVGGWWGMGGNTTAVGNVGNTSAEFNWYQDPEAAHIVLTELGQMSCQSVLLPWEPCINLPITKEWRFNTLAKHGTKQMELLNRVEESLHDDCTTWVSCDALLAAAFVDERVITNARDEHLTIELTGTHTRGQGVLVPGSKPNVRIIHQIDCNIIKEIFMTTAKYQA